jgi:hypothetical protein
VPRLRSQLGSRRQTSIRVKILAAPDVKAKVTAFQFVLEFVP